MLERATSAYRLTTKTVGELNRETFRKKWNRNMELGNREWNCQIKDFKMKKKQLRKTYL